MSDMRLPKTNLFVFPARRGVDPAVPVPAPVLPAPNVTEPDLMRGAFLSVSKNDRIYPALDGRATSPLNAGSLIAGAAITGLFCAAVIVAQDYPDQATDAVSYVTHQMTEFYCADLRRPYCR